MPAGLCRESPFTALASEAIFAATDDQPTQPTPAIKTTNKRRLANEKLTLIFTLTNVLYGIEKVQDGNGLKLENFVGANTITGHGSMIR